MVKTYDLLQVQQEQSGHWSVRLAQKIDEQLVSAIDRQHRSLDPTCTHDLRT